MEGKNLLTNSIHKVICKTFVIHFKGIQFASNLTFKRPLKLCEPPIRQNFCKLLGSLQRIFRPILVDKNNWRGKSRKLNL